MPGRRGYAFHEGDRSEYLATFVLSSIATVTPVPRQEDYGLDHLCALTRKEKYTLHVESSFGVQVKSVSEKEVVYGGHDENGKWKRWEPKWLFHQDYPMFIASINKTNWRVKLYSTSRMWGPQWLSGGPYEIHLAPEIKQYETAQGGDHRFRKKKSEKSQAGIDGDGHTWEVALSRPIIDVGVEQIENKSFRNTLYECLKRWIQLEQQNITCHRLGIPYTVDFKEWKSNEPPGPEIMIGHYRNPTPGMNIGRILSSIHPAIAGLIHNFDSQGDYKKLRIVAQIAPLLKEYNCELDPFIMGIIEKCSNENTEAE